MACFLVRILALLAFLVSLSCAFVVRVNSIVGCDVSCCWRDGQEPCKSLMYVTANVGGQSDLEIFLETDADLQEIVLFKNVSDILLRGISERNRKIAIHCSPNASMIFENVGNITISNLKFIGCGSSNNESHYEAAILFKSSFGIIISNVSITESHFGALVFLACFQDIILDMVELANNSYDEQCPCFPAGVSIEITTSNMRANYLIRDSTIENNQAASSHPCKYQSTSDIVWMGNGLGGGIGVYFADDCEGNFVTIENTNVVNNTGKWGGGIYIQFQNTTQNNNVFIGQSCFNDNSAFKAGGGINIVFLNDYTFKNHTNCVELNEVRVVNNSAQKYGGGIVITASFSDTAYEPGKNLVFKHCNISNNTALYSPAADISPFYYKNKPQNGFLPIPYFHDVSVVNNCIVQNYTTTPKKIEISTGVLAVRQFTIYFHGKIIFRKNRFSALLLSSAYCVFDDGTTAFFENNTSADGTIAMYGFSTLFVAANTYIEFYGNNASGFGGGIFYQTSDQLTFITSRRCFIQYFGNITEPNDRNITIIFHKNFAKSGGSSIYADSFFSCQYECNGTTTKVPLNIDSVMDCIGNVTYDTEDRSLQSSSSDFVFKDGFDGHLEAIPGAKVSIPFHVTDEFNQTVKPLMNIKLLNSSLEISPQFTLTNQTTPKGSPKDTASLLLVTQGIGGISFNFTLTLLECPPGFYFSSEESRECVCSASSDENGHNAIRYCNKTLARMKRNYWAGYIPPNSTSHKNLYFAPCFQPLCNNKTWLPKFPELLESYLCYGKRTNTLCAHCVKEHTVYFHSPEFLCKPSHGCQFGPIFYFISEIVPVTALFGFVVIFDLSLTSGHTVGFVLFCQSLDQLAIHVSDTFSHIEKPCQLFYSIFNFEFFTIERLSFCLWKDFQILDVLVVKYVTVLFALALVVFLTYLLKRNQCLWILKWRTKATTKTSFVHGLSAFLVICYSQCTRISFLILKFTKLENWNGTASTDWYSYYGGIPYMEGRHRIYAILAIVFLVFVTLPPPLILFLYPLTLHFLSLCKLSEHWIVNKILKLLAINKLLPFMDCFQSCYKDKLRFFAGLYFSYRVILLALYTFFYTFYSYRGNSEILLILLYGIHSVIQPYKKRLHNVLDSLIFLDLVLINACSMYINYIQTLVGDTYERDIQGVLEAVTIFQVVLLYLPMLVLLSCASIKIFFFFKSRCCRKDYEMLENRL